MAAMFPDGIHADGSVYPIVPGGYAVVGELPTVLKLSILCLISLDNKFSCHFSSRLCDWNWHRCKAAAIFITSHQLLEGDWWKLNVKKKIVEYKIATVVTHWLVWQDGIRCNELKWHPAEKLVWICCLAANSSLINNTQIVCKFNFTYWEVSLLIPV